VEHLQRLGDELDVHEPAAPELYVKAPRALFPELLLHA